MAVSAAAIFKIAATIKDADDFDIVNGVAVRHQPIKKNIGRLDQHPRIFLKIGMSRSSPACGVHLTSTTTVGRFQSIARFLTQLTEINWLLFPDPTAFSERRRRRFGAMPQQPFLKRFGKNFIGLFIFARCNEPAQALCLSRGQLDIEFLVQSVCIAGAEATPSSSFRSLTYPLDTSAAGWNSSLMKVLSIRICSASVFGSLSVFDSTMPPSRTEETMSASWSICTGSRGV
ncbi:hypothetical protein EV132_102504 [Rhizobium sullae]|uniref:Uncharacterized protein n=1 Tax=Rhizobium sullae TaxID=50338 RepID=A0A4R3QCJ3_RHISU|nr:hypothetical protein EV132_102504 [Rhizobium sullae]